MSFIRPEVQEKLAKTRPFAIGAGLLLLGLYWLVDGGGVMRFVGAGLAVLGGVLLWDGARRARFPASGDGSGVVEIDERRITYYGPDGGSSVSLNDVARIRINTTDQGPFMADLYWEFTERSGLRLVFPGDAVGAEKIFDALAVFDGADFQAIVEANTHTEDASFLVWEDAQLRLEG
ncbi:hypothetical protein AIOL_001219 [Candidatus Rhodobacter oscarellae]|uniref:Uncharacterized protein n=1 Tax=Candidatus Rhodobacter oscarellae TaxID=1675527 RepID=A0A0J9E0S6_9RHOB|nr:hypothetical protein [Candidatus Rhodobacter lobularis]KMW56267.1 hypothetical protein AIOL_001219 [Candidatus Rhodobacter lobularis]